MKLTNKAMLITYPDSLGKNMQDLRTVLDKYLDGVVGGLHLLPFFPSTGDRGFAPTDYTQVDPAFGTWQDVENLARDHYLMVDFMINHISKQSSYFQDFVAHHNDSPYKDMFIRINQFFPDGRPTAEDIDKIYKRKDKAPFQTVHFADGTSEEVWNTFGEEQIDLDVTTPVTQRFIRDTIASLASHGTSLVRLDAFAYAVKKLGTSDFFVEPEIWDLLTRVKANADASGVTLLPEIHEHYTIPLKISQHGYYIYDFALPMILLYSLYAGKSERLAHWLRLSPMHQFTTLDTHDGIGVVDAKDLLSDDELDYTTKELYKVGANVKKVYSSAAYHNLDVYQINSTYYGALGDDDASYLLARAIQCFAPGIPQVYYVGLLAGKNDIKLLENTKEGRNINRHYYSLGEIDETVQRPVVQKLFALLRFRNQSAAFDLDGSIDVTTPDAQTIVIRRSAADGSVTAELLADLATKQFTVTENGSVVTL
ncbi:sucrose phosphorylase [Schleiferilactobacillus shenzhenensis]|nr:sucrose phosphorylase [Schleiferilactobacillus shenzhenensis]